MASEEQRRAMRQVWHIFQIRKALLTNRFLGFSFGNATSMQLPDIQVATVSLLYIDLVSILDEAMETQIEPEQLDCLRSVHARIKHLQACGAVLDAEALLAIKTRRNEISHEATRKISIADLSASLSELKQACAVVHAQLKAWGLVDDHPPYQLTYERTGARGSADPAVLSEQDQVIRIMRGEATVCEWKETLKVLKD